MVVDAVCREPVSVQNSLLTGKNTGKIGRICLFSLHILSKRPGLQALGQEFPDELSGKFFAACREFPDRLQGTRSLLSGNGMPVAG